tara:strand:- start:444 stop:1508 length:1065 start_codon:yes stop_codon:yes gene_type:complete
MPLKNTCSNLRYFFVPFANLKNNISDPLIIVIALAWSIIIENYEIDLPYGLDENNLVIGIISATLGFLLSLNLAHYLEQNRNGMDLYQNYVDNIFGIAWMICTLEDPDDDRIKNNEDIDNQDLISTEMIKNKYYVRLKYKLFGILKLMPTILKHHFRGDYDLNIMESMEKDPFVIDVIKDLRNLDKLDNVTSPVDNIMFLLVLKLKHLKGDITVIHGKLDQLYACISSISALVKYSTPIIFSYVLITALVIYTALLPLGYSGRSWYNVWITFVIMYFFIGLNSAGKFVRNPFVSLPEGITIFPTATNIQRKARISIESIEKHGERNGFEIDKATVVNDRMMGRIIKYNTSKLIY